MFEHVYFARPDSYVFGESVNEVRTDLGRRLAREAPVEADVIVPIPDSGVCAAVGYAEASGIPMRMGLIRNHYVGRTFIQPQQSIRHFGVKVKLNPVRSIIEGKRVVLVDDSIVRGTTSRKIVRMVRSAGAREVHMRISCPPTISPCFYGVDTPRRSELIAATHTLEEIRKYLDADSVAYLSLEGLTGAVKGGSVEVLHVVLHRRVSGGLPARRGGVSAAGAEAEWRNAGARTRGSSSTPGSRKILSSADACGFDALHLLLSVTLASTLPVAAQQPSAPDVNAFIDRLGNFDYATRMNAARTIRRVPGVRRPCPPLTEAARKHPRSVRPLPRPRAADGVQRPANPRPDAAACCAIATIVSARWPTGGSRRTRSPRWPFALLTSLQTEQAEFVRPALVAALAALGSDPQVQRALVAEAGRGFDFFRIAVIEALASVAPLMPSTRSRRLPDSTARFRTTRCWRSGGSAVRGPARRWHRSKADWTGDCREPACGRSACWARTAKGESRRWWTSRPIRAQARRRRGPRLRRSVRSRRSRNRRP